MKKLLSIILALAMLLTSVAASAAMPVEKIPDFLNKVGIIKAGQYADKTKVLTRGEFVKMISNLILDESLAKISTEQVFKDIPLDSEIFAVTTLLNKTYNIVGDGNGYFEPDENITAEAVCKILVHILGDEYFARYYGGYIPAAANKQLLKHVEFDENSNVTVEAAMRLIYNTMNADISNSNTYDGNADEDTTYQTYMSKRLGINKISGTVTDDGVTGISGATTIKEDEIQIENYVLKNATGYKDIVGYEVEGFYKYDKDLNESTLIYVYFEGDTDSDDGTGVGVKDPNLLELADKDLVRYNNYTYEYYEDENQDELLKAYLNTNFRLIYNGYAYTKASAEASFNKSVDEMLMPDSGWVRLRDTDSDGYYDLVTVKDYTIVVLSSIDTDNYVVYGDPKYTDVIIDLKGAEDDMIVKDADGSIYDLDTLDRGDVLSIAESADGKHVEIMYSANKVEGNLAAIDGDIYTVDATEYRTTNEFEAYVSRESGTGNAISLGVHGQFCLTFDDRIAYFKNSSEASIKVGLLGTAFAKSSFDDELILYILTDTGSFDQLKVASKVNVNGSRWTQGLSALKTELDGFCDKLIRYRLNADSEINWIDTPYIMGETFPGANESDDSLHIVEGGNDVDIRYNKNQLSFWGRFLMDSSVVQFVTYPSEEFENSTVQTYASLGSTVNMHMTAYSTDTESMFVDYIVIENDRVGANVYTAAPTTGVVLKISDTVDDDGETIKKLLITTNGTHYTEIYAEQEALVCKCGLGDCATSPLEVGAGDIIQYAATGDVIDETIICYDYSQKRLVSPGNNAYFGTYKNNTFTTGTYAQGHAWTPELLDTTSTSSYYYSRRSANTILEVNCFNKIENQAAEIEFAFWPFTEDHSLNSSDEVVEYASSQPLLKRYSISSMYAIRVNAEKGTFTPMRIADIKTYNNGAGTKETGYMLWASGVPKLLIYYK